MGMFTAVVCFSTAIGVLLRISRHSPLFESLVVNLGWLAVVVYTANVITRLVLSSLPKAVVNPENKAVLITGCDSGFGFYLAQRLAKSGFIVYAGCLEEDGEGAKELRKSSHNLHIIPLDVTNHDQVHAATKDVESRLEDKELWAIVNNAGVAVFSELEWCSMSVIEHMFKVNVLGAMRVTKAFLPLLRRSSTKGRVIVVSSVAGHLTYPGFMTYSMTKHALVAFGDGLRREMRKWGISVSSIEPSMYRTRIVRKDVLTGALDNSWERTPDSIKEAYGFPYYEDFRSRMQKLALRARPYVDEVVDCMERAVIEVHPSITYRCSGPVDKIRLWLMSIMPVAVLDFVICYLIQPNRRQLSSNGDSPSTPKLS